MIAALSVIISRALGISDGLELFLLNKKSLCKKFLETINPSILEKVSERKAIAEFKRAAKTTPAYKDFLKKNRINAKNINSIKDFNNAPITTKENYITKYPYEKLCINGALPIAGDVCESSGATGKPTNWVHAIKEDSMLFKLAEFEFDYLYGLYKRYIVINAWLTGAWSTGIKFAEITERCALVKNTSMEQEKIIQTLENFGNTHHYLIAGYPPFLQQLFEDKRVKWKDYKIDVLTGCEATIPEWKKIIKKRLSKDSIIYSAYGASDLNIGIAIETPFTDFIRGQLVKNKNLLKELFPLAEAKGEIPMVFQYNPLMYFIENINSKNEKGEQVTEVCFTLLDKKCIAPKIRYNIRDEGRKFAYKEIISALKKYASADLRKFLKRDMPLHLPFLAIFGRTDGTISVIGSNIYPDQVERAIAYNPKLFKSLNRFMLHIGQTKSRFTAFNILIELIKGVKPTQRLRSQYKKQIETNLGKLNEDYTLLLKTNPTSAKARVKLYPFGSSKFSQYNSRIKQKYIE
ncbi:phenylacetate--CoA ligase family protein [archaeon]|nr:phenylacetate--CoA ligase family protein [archaeon]